MKKVELTNSQLDAIVYSLMYVTSRNTDVYYNASHKVLFNALNKLKPKVSKKFKKVDYYV